jgi:glycine/D-amino acid oxidase-like deaminating enzyme
MDDVVVIGGGVAGLSAGAAISALARVTVLEGEEALGHHASGRSAAMYEPGYGSPAAVVLTEASREALEGGGFLSPRGLMLVGKDEDRPRWEADRAGFGMPAIGLAEARAMVPVLAADVVLAAWHADAWDIDTDRLMQGYARDIRAAGGTIRTRARVTAMRRIAGGWAVTAGDAVHEARLVVNAGGAWADGVAVMAGLAPKGLVPHRRSMARIPAPGGHDVARWPMILGAGETWYAKPDAGALIVSPADEEPMDPHDAWADDMVLAEGLARWEAHVDAPVTRLIASWAGLRTKAPDASPVLGPDPDDPAFVWCAGQSGQGFQTAPAAARLVADLVAGRAPAVDAATVAAVSPARAALRSRAAPAPVA